MPINTRMRLACKDRSSSVGLNMLSKGRKEQILSIQMGKILTTQKIFLSSQQLLLQLAHTSSAEQPCLCRKALVTTGKGAALEPSATSLSWH